MRHLHRESSSRNLIDTPPHLQRTEPCPYTPGEFQVDSAQTQHTGSKTPDSSSPMVPNSVKAQATSQQPAQAQPFRSAQLAFPTRPEPQVGPRGVPVTPPQGFVS